MDIGDCSAGLKFDWYLKFKEWYNAVYPFIKRDFEEKKHPEDKYIRDIHDTLKPFSPDLSQEVQMQQQEEDKPKEMIVARNTIAV